MKKNKLISLALVFVAIATVFLISSCGGSSSSAPAATTVSISVVAVGK